ncbi:hypothetical protein PR003_g11778 [Phytophthora rubi]|uniref:Uncharacterized protein n=1 Tax=Phytophthora rubi TaxID=129364 RepID=A0A6A4F774_9STRA|nr:hypothetical protein PR003_g11778 [Phytophthora rubi]
MHGLKPGYSAYLASAIDAHSAPNPLVCAPNRNPRVGFVLTAGKEACRLAEHYWNILIEDVGERAIQCRRFWATTASATPVMAALRCWWYACVTKEPSFCCYSSRVSRSGPRQPPAWPTPAAQTTRTLRRIAVRDQTVVLSALLRDRLDIVRARAQRFKERPTR